MGTLQAVTGMNDILPGDVERWRTLEEAFRTTCARYGFHEVRTPLCEFTELFTRGVGEGTDIVEKEMYTFLDRGDRSLTLRPEGTASAVRASIEHGILATAPVVRWYYLGPMFRAEKPARGRFRQFHQVGAEVYGDDSPAADAEMIDLAVAFLRALGLEKFLVRVNTLGSGDTRARYREALVAYLEPRKSELSPESQARLVRNPLRVLDSKDPKDVAVKAGAPSILDALSPEDRTHFERVCAYLTALGVPFTVDPHLVRGLDYYSRTVFEVVDQSGNLGAQDSLGAGGRYDGLFTELGGPATPAVGIALGVERLLLAMNPPPAAKPFEVAVVAAAKAHETEVLSSALALAQTLRREGLTAHVDTRFHSMKSQMRRANDLGAAAVLILGGNELAAGVVTVKHMATSKESKVPRADLVAWLRNLAVGAATPTTSG